MPKKEQKKELYFLRGKNSEPPPNHARLPAYSSSMRQILVFFLSSLSFVHECMGFGQACLLALALLASNGRFFISPGRANVSRHGRQTDIRTYVE